MHHILRLKPIFFLCLILPLFTSCESRKIIVNGLNEREANEIWVFLSGKGIDVTKVQTAEAGGGGGRRGEVLWDVSVRADQAGEALNILNQAGLPRRPGQSLLGIFKEAGGIVPSEMQEKIKYQAGLNEQISNTLRKIEGVLDAEVLISFPEEDPLGLSERKQAITASIFIKHSGTLDDPNTHIETKIRRLVASSVTGLDYDNVTVVGVRARSSDLSGRFPGVISDADKLFVNVWSVIIAKESVGYFRILFFSFIFIILLLTLLLTWTLWKILPLLKEYGGISSLFKLQSIKEIPEETEEETAEEEPEETKKKKPEEGEKESEGEKEDKGPPSEVT